MPLPQSYKKPITRKNGPPLSGLFRFVEKPLEVDLCDRHVGMASRRKVVFKDLGPGTSDESTAISGRCGWGLL